MPISFPPPICSWSNIQAKNLYLKMGPSAANLANPGYVFTSQTLDGGRGKIIPRPNPINPGINFAITYQRPVDMSPQFLINAKRWLEEDGTLNMVLSGVSRDSTGATLGNCQVLVFRTEDKSLVAETTSDSSGAWSLSVLKGGPFFLVEYKVGAPDVFGTSPNNLVAAVVP